MKKIISLVAIGLLVTSQTGAAVGLQLPKLNEGAIVKARQSCQESFSENALEGGTSTFTGTALAGLGAYIYSKTKTFDGMEGIAYYFATTSTIAGGIALYYGVPKLWKILQPQEVLEVIMEVQAERVNGPMIAQLKTIAEESGMDAQGLLDTIVEAANRNFLCQSAYTIEQIVNNIVYQR